MNRSTNPIISENTDFSPSEQLKKKFFFDWVHIAKGLGISLVVIGHHYPSVSPVYWSGIRSIIYSFHMPLFFIISGYLYSYATYPYASLVKSKIKRLAYPFLTTAFIFLIIKYIAGKFFVLQYPVNLSSINKLFIDPVNSFMPLLWFVHALLIIFFIYPLGRLILNNNFILLLLLAANIFFGNNFLVFGKALANAPYFAFGVMLREQNSFSRIIMGQRWQQITIPFIIFILLYWLERFGNPPKLNLICNYFLGVIGSLFILNLSHRLTSYKCELLVKKLIALGEYSMGIYLLHPLFESAVRITFEQNASNYRISFEVIALTAITCGLIIPALLEKYILRKYRLTKHYLLGL